MQLSKENLSVILVLQKATTIRKWIFTSNTLETIYCLQGFQCDNDYVIDIIKLAFLPYFIVLVDDL